MKELKKSLDFLRGIAALGVVVLYHYNNILLPTLNPNNLTNIFCHLWLYHPLFDAKIKLYHF